MTQPNLIETIEKALKEANIPYEFNENNGELTKNSNFLVSAFIYHDEDANLIVNAPEWLRALLEEVKTLQQKLKDYEGCKGVEDYYRVLYQLRETKEENNRLQIAVGQFKEELSARRTTHET